MNSQVTAAPKRSWSKRHGKLLVAAIVVLILVATAGALLAIKWPFTPAKVTGELASATSGRVKIHGFRAKYFPPGCVMDGVELRQSGDSSAPPLLTARRLTIRSNYRGLLHKRVEFMHLEDVRVDMGQRARHSGGDSSGSSTTDSASIAEITVDRAVIEFPRKKGPLQFNVYRLALGSFVRGKPTSFHATLNNPLPPGRVGVDGQFGPWNSSDIAATPLSGSYTFTDANLSSLGGIAGTLSSKGSFAGPARALRVQGSTDTPNFEVKSAGHLVRLRTEFQAVVNCSNGDVKLPGIHGQFGKATFTVAGDVVGKDNPRSKVASLQVNDSGGRVEDWLLLLASDQTPPMTGPISFQARVTIPGGPRPFLRRVRLQGDFELTAVEFTKEKSRRGAAELSLRAQGQKVSDAKETLPRIPGRLTGHVELLDGVANFSTLTFALPGAVANVRGTFDFSQQKIDLHGQLRVDTKFSKTSGGPKAVLTRATEALFAKSKGDGEVLPVKMTGTYDYPSYGLDK
jgi:AsmA-like C-terminal region